MPHEHQIQRPWTLCARERRPKLEWPSKAVTVVTAEENKSHNNIYHVLNTYTLPGTPLPALHMCFHFISIPSMLSILFSQMRKLSSLCPLLPFFLPSDSNNSNFESLLTLRKIKIENHCCQSQPSHAEPRRSQGNGYENIYWYSQWCCLEQCTASLCVSARLDTRSPLRPLPKRCSLRALFSNE